MLFCSLMSGSSGNCQYIEYRDTKILVDAGASGKKIETLLKKIDRDIQDIDAIFVTHEHLDHVKGVGVLSRKYNIKVFSTEDTFREMLPITKNLSPENVYLFENKKPFYFKDLYISPVKIFHDCIEGSSFSIWGDKKISILTDTGYVSCDMYENIKESSLYCIEANHDYTMLMNGPYSWSLKTRVASNKGHLSNDNAAEVLIKVLNKKNEKIVLSHLSKENNTPEIAHNTIKNTLDMNNLKLDIDFNMEVAKRDEPSTIYKL